MTTRTESEIVICNRCNGIGTTEHKEIEDYHNNEYKHWNEVCNECYGTGRLKITTETTVTVESYDNPEVAELVFDKLKKKSNSLLA